MFPWGGHWPESCCICLAEGLLTFSGCKRAVCPLQQAQLLLTTFPSAALRQCRCFVKEWGRYLLGFGRLGFKGPAAACTVAALGFHAEGKRWTPNSLAWMYECSLQPCAEILFPVRCCLTPLSDGVSSWKTLSWNWQKLWSVWSWGVLRQHSDLFSSLCI